MPIHDADPLIAPARQDSGVTLSGLRAFVAVTEAGSFSGAARALGVTQPSVSVQLAALERACGLLLCHRKPEVVLTQAGQDLFVRARLILSRVQEFEASVVDLQQAQGRLVVGLSTPHAAMPLIAGFSARWPDISLRTVLGNTTTLLEDVSRCRLDVAVMTMMQASAQLECVLVSSPRLTVCLRADDPLARRTSLRPADLLGRDFIAREAGSQTRALFEASFTAAGCVPRFLMEVGSREAMREAVAAGLGLGMLFENENGEDRRLAMVPLQVGARLPGVYVVALKESLGIPVVRAFFDHVCAQVTRPRGAGKRQRRP